MIDPKMGLEFGLYEDLPFLDNKIVDNPEEAVNVLVNVVKEMDIRYKLFREENVRKLSEYNKKKSNGEKLPYIVIIIDEFADIILDENQKTRKDLASVVQKLAQKGRAAGVHIIIATQKPVNECFPTMIKGNIPARIAFRVTKSEESNVILGETGAESLFGKGDMLVKDPNIGAPRRFQAPLIKNDEIECFVKSVKSIYK
jgi:S-DNA-T family DNA segregation ATPase FtsK/SpoIIIE